MEPEVGPRQPDAVGAACLSVCAAGVNGGGGGEAEQQADLRDELLLQPATCRRRHRRRARCVPSCSTTTRAEREGQHGATCACMRVVLCRLWVLNVWLLCTHTHTHTSACTLTAAAAATACTVGCACVREHTRAFPRTSC